MCIQFSSSNSELAATLFFIGQSTVECRIFTFLHDFRHLRGLKLFECADVTHQCSDRLGASAHLSSTMTTVMTTDDSLDYQSIHVGCHRVMDFILHHRHRKSSASICGWNCQTKSNTSFIFLFIGLPSAPVMCPKLILHHHGDFSCRMIDRKSTNTKLICIIRT